MLVSTVRKSHYFGSSPLQILQRFCELETMCTRQGSTPHLRVQGCERCTAAHGKCCTVNNRLGVIPEAAELISAAG